MNTKSSRICVRTGTMEYLYTDSVEFSMSTRTIRGYGPILLSSKRGNHRSKRYYWYKVELDNGRRTREILFVPPINPILNSGQAENDWSATRYRIKQLRYKDFL